jgi:GNAT superfamily N-acetyltransferase
MILLEKEKYKKLIEPLSGVKINHLFARSVIEHCVTGKVYVDNKNNPATFYIVHPYGVSLLFGKYDNYDFNKSFKEYALNTGKIRDEYEWMQTYPRDWDIILSELFEGCIVKSSDNIDNKDNGRIELNTRVNFKFNLSKYLDLKERTIGTDLKMVRTDKQIFKDMKGSVIPLYFWDSAEDFFTKGVGYSLFHNGELASTAYSAFIHDDKLEIGIETIEKFRGKGYAQYTCSRLIDYCLENNYVPIWSCKLENVNSYRLALKLGFEPTLEIPFYRLCK